MLKLLKDFGDLVEYRFGVGVVPLSRNWMAAPFSGGAEAKRVGSVNPFDCSTGFAVRKTSNGGRYMMTAGHCGALNSSWISPGSGHTIGTMRFRQMGPSDLALIGDKTYQPVIYTGGAAGVASTVKGAANPVLNTPIYCASGAKTFEHCDLWVVNMTTDTCYSGACFIDQMAFKKGGSCPIRGGDSGGPFYLDFDFGGFPYIRGMITGGLTDNSECYGEYWSRISGGLGVTIVTG